MRAFNVIEKKEQKKNSKKIMSNQNPKPYALISRAW